MRLKRFRRFISKALFAAGLLHAWQWVRNHLLGRRGVIILAYHRLGVPSDTFLNMKVPPELFERQLRFLQRRFEVLSLDEAMQALRGSRRLKRDAVVLTFDDGYADNFALLYPILKKYGAPATIFLSVEAIECRDFMWWDKLASCLSASANEILDLQDFALGRYVFSEESKASVCTELIARMKRLPRTERDRVLEAVRQRLDVTREPGESDRMLTWEEAQEMNGGLVTFGSHGMSHTILTNLREEDVRWELQTSRRIMQDRLGSVPDFYAFPNGRRRDFDGRIVEMVRACGYGAAFTLLDGTNYPGKSAEAYQLKRRLITCDPGPEAAERFSEAGFYAELLGLWDPWRKASD